MLKQLIRYTVLCFIILFALPCGASGLKQQTLLSGLSPAAQAGIMEAVGRDDTCFHAVKISKGLKVNNGRHNISDTFSPDGVVVSNGRNHWSLRLVSLGRESAQLLPVTTKVSASANRVEFRHQAVTEWYVNSPAGLEQGFTIPARPDGPGDKLLTITLSGAGLKPVIASASELSLVRPDNSVAFRYGGLAAWDADGRSLPVQMALADKQVVLKVDDRGANYPVTVDPTFQSSTLYADDGAANDNFGYCVALSGDGNTALVGARSKAVGGNIWQGAAYVFVRTGNGWSQQARLTASNGVANNAFGISVTLSYDGNTALVGAPGKDFGASNNNQGAAYVFVRSGVEWSQQAIITSSDGAAYDQFGTSVSLSGDGTTALVGACGKTIRENFYQGAAYVFVRSGTVWNQRQV